LARSSRTAENQPKTAAVLAIDGMNARFEFADFTCLTLLFAFKLSSRFNALLHLGEKFPKQLENLYFTVSNLFHPPIFGGDVGHCPRVHSGYFVAYLLP